MPISISCGTGEGGWGVTPDSTTSCSVKQTYVHMGGGGGGEGLFIECGPDRGVGVALIIHAGGEVICHAPGDYFEGN